MSRFTLLAVFCLLALLAHYGHARSPTLHEAAPSPTALSAIESLPWRSMDAPSSIAAARGLIGRYYPLHLSRFNLSIVDKIKPSDADYFILSSSPSASRIDIRGTSAVMLTAGFNYYLSYYLNVTLLTWSSAVPPLLPPFVPLSSPVRIPYPYLYRYYYNICTLSYSTQWWAFDQWEREIDWMALRGVNFPLALNGQELVWYEVYEELGLNSTEILDFIAGPAFLAWQRMGNIQGWGGPMTMSWMRQQVRLQQQLLQRMRSLDMYPILAAFDGYVPTAMKLHYPNATIAPSSGWSTFPAKYQNDDLLDPKDPLFQTIGSLYIKKQTETFGTDHFYNSDVRLHTPYTLPLRLPYCAMYSSSAYSFLSNCSPQTYNENAPSTNDTTYLAEVSAAVYSSMTLSDPKAVWVMQGWVFVNDPSFWQPAQVKSYLGSVPNDRMIILDLMSDVSPVFPRTQNYFGKLFIWNMLHNFGGNNGMMGMLDVISQQPPLAKKSVGDALIGIGTTPEGIFQNEITYDLLFDMAHRSVPISNIKAWVRQWATRRYSLPAQSLTRFESLFRSFDLLVSSVYNCTNGQWGVTKSFLELTPDLQMNYTGFMGTSIWYDNSILERAFALHLSVSELFARDNIAGRERYQYDLIDIGKQWMSNLLISYHAQLVHSYNAKNVTAVKSIGSVILSLISDWDSLLSTNVHYLLGPWIADARRWGLTVKEQDDLEFNARNQITLWGPTGQIADYASKQWSGLISGYYQPRWQMFISTLTDATEKGVTWDSAAYNTAKRVVEEAWQVSKEKYPTTPTGNTVQYARYVFNKWSTKRAEVDRVEMD